MQCDTYPQQQRRRPLLVHKRLKRGTVRKQQLAAPVADVDHDGVGEGVGLGEDGHHTSARGGGAVVPAVVGQQLDAREEQAQRQQLGGLKGQVNSPFRQVKSPSTKVNSAFRQVNSSSRQVKLPSGQVIQHPDRSFSVQRGQLTVQAGQISV